MVGVVANNGRELFCGRCGGGLGARLDVLERELAGADRVDHGLGAGGHQHVRDVVEVERAVVEHLIQVDEHPAEGLGGRIRVVERTVERGVELGDFWPHVNDQTFEGVSDELLQVRPQILGADHTDVAIGLAVHDCIALKHAHLVASFLA